MFRVCTLLIKRTHHVSNTIANTLSDCRKKKPKTFLYVKPFTNFIIPQECVVQDKNKKKDKKILKFMCKTSNTTYRSQDKVKKVGVV